jgi:hypothetical protein
LSQDPPDLGRLTKAATGATTVVVRKNTEWNFIVDLDDDAKVAMVGPKFAVVNAWPTGPQDDVL